MSERRPIPRAYENDRYAWNLSRVPDKIEIDGKTYEHPGRNCAIFVVHGIGDQKWTQTSANLRSGFEDCFELISKWQTENPPKPDRTDLIQQELLAPPFIFDGYWSDYADLEATFPEEVAKFNERERNFFGNLWKNRSSTLRTYFWFLRQQIRILNPRLIKKVGIYYLAYFPLQVVALVAITFSLLRQPRILRRFIQDVRLYADPSGIIERTVVQRIDYRVGEKFLRLMGLDWNFENLKDSDLIETSGKKVTFDRIIWVSHSLGTVVSYNVLSDLFHRAAEMEQDGTDEQKRGVNKFRQTLRRFITMGSPLEKIAFLFGDGALRPWPNVDRQELIQGGELLPPTKSQNKKPNPDKALEGEWWVNFYNIFDPVSGVLRNKMICGSTPPMNLLSKTRLLSLIPGMAHAHYWTDIHRTQRFILSRAFGPFFLRDKSVKPYAPWVRLLLSIAGIIFWMGLIFLLPWAVFKFSPELIRFFWPG